MSRNYASEKTVTFTYEVPEGKMFASSPPERLDVQIEGRGWELMFDYLLNPRVEVTFDLSNQDGLELTREEFRSAIARQIPFEEVRIRENSYNAISLRLEDGLTKTVPVVLNDSITFMPGYVRQGFIKVKPDSVRVSGPNSLIDSIMVWETTPLVIEDLKSNFSQQVLLASPPSEIKLSWEQVQVSMQAEQVTEKSFFVPLQVRNAPDSLKYFPEKVKVTCTIGLSAYSSIDTNDFTVEIDLNKVSLSEGKHTLPIKMTKKPEEALSVQFTPKSAEFFIFKK